MKQGVVVLKDQTFQKAKDTAKLVGKAVDEYKKFNADPISYIREHVTSASEAVKFIARGIQEDPIGFAKKIASIPQEYIDKIKQQYREDPRKLFFDLGLTA